MYINLGSTIQWKADFPIGSSFSGSTVKRPGKNKYWAIIFTYIDSAWSIYSRVVPDIQPAGYPAFFGSQYPAGYLVSYAEYLADRISGLPDTGYSVAVH